MTAVLISHSELSGQPRSLPAGWVRSTLGEAVDILDSQRVPVNSEERGRRPGQIPYYGATGQVGWIDKYIFDEELVLLGEDGAPFLDNSKPKAYMIRGKTWVNNHAHVLRGRPGILNAFVLHQLNQVDYHKFVSGTTRMKLPQGPMRRIPFLVAPEPEQRRIVAEIEKQFTRLEAGVTALRRMQANLKRYRAAVLKDACEGPWPMTTLGECFQVDRGRFGHRPRNEPRFYNGRYPFVQIGDLPREGGSITNFTQTLNEKGLAISKLFPKGTVLIAIVGATIGNTGILTFDSCAPDSLVALQSNDETLLKFGEFYLCSKKLEIRNTSYSSGGQPNINLAFLRAYPIPVPPLAERKRIVAEVERRLSVVEELSALVESNLKRATRLRQSILQQAFEGKL